MRIIFLVNLKSSVLFSFKSSDDFWKKTLDIEDDITNNGVPIILRLKKYTPASLAPKNVRIKIGIKLFAKLFITVEGSKYLTIDLFCCKPFLICLKFIFESMLLFLKT